MSRRSSTETIMASPKIFGSEDFQDLSIDVSSDSMRVEIGKRPKEKSDSKFFETQKSFDKTSETQKSFDKMSETQKSFGKMSETQNSFDKMSERSVSMDSPRQSSISRDSSTETVLQTPTKKIFDKFPFEQIKPPQLESKTEETVKQLDDKSKLNQVRLLFQSYLQISKLLI